VRKKTKSLWSLVASTREQYVNALYVSAYQNHVLLPNAAIRHLEFWSGYFSRWNPNMRMQVRASLHLLEHRL